MITWEEFFEAKESGKDIEAEEERLHKDLDGDDEEGESAEHKAKIECKPCKSKKSKKSKKA